MSASPARVRPLPLPRQRGDFAGTLGRLMRRDGWSQNALAKLVGVNPSYVNRICSGERDTPTREVVLALARGMASTADDTDRLMASAGYLPPSQQKLGIDSTVQAVVRLLADDRYSPESRADLRAVIETLCARWAVPMATTPGPAARRLRERVAAAWERNGGGDA